jgi:hypothetical protein
MFTVNHVVGGVETIFQTKMVSFDRNAGLTIDADELSAKLSRRLLGGRAFVMNAAGATVAKYELPEDYTQTASPNCGQIYYDPPQQPKVPD